MIVADLNQGRGGQAAGANEFLSVGERHHVGPAVPDDRAELHCPGSPPLLQRRAEKDEPVLTAVYVHGDGTSPGRAHDHLRPVLV